MSGLTCVQSMPLALARASIGTSPALQTCFDIAAEQVLDEHGRSCERLSAASSLAGRLVNGALPG